MLNRNAIAIGLIVTTCGLLGCGGGGKPDRPATTEVTGVVTYKNAPVEGATVTFSPTTINVKPAFGTTDAEGKFSLTTFESGDGAMADAYLVSISKLEEVASKAVSTDDPNYDPNYVAPTPKHLLPQKYSSIATSGLSTTVGKEKVSDLKFELVD